MLFTRRRLPGFAVPAFFRSKREQGFVLIVVIAAVGLLAMAAATFAKVTRAHIKSTMVAVETARADTIAEAGVNIAVLKLLAFRSNPNGGESDFATRGRVLGCLIDDNALFVRVLDEGGKIDLNFASERLLRALLVGLRVGSDRVDAVVDTVLDYRDGDNVKRPKGAEEGDYLAAGRAVGPKNAPFAALEELDHVLGVDPDLVTRMLPYVTAHSGRDGIDPMSAQRELIELLKLGDTPNTAPSEIENDQEFQDRMPDLPTHFMARSGRSIFAVRAEVVLSGGVRFAREAIVDISPQQGRPFRLWRWRRATSHHLDAAFQTGELPDCDR
jgi:general secretion pathway protein K